MDAEKTNQVLPQYVSVDLQMRVLQDMSMKDILLVCICILFLRVVPYLEDGKDNLPHGIDILCSILDLVS